MNATPPPSAAKSAPRQLTHAEHVPAAGPPLPLRLLLPGLRDAANVGALFRLADALGVEYVHLAGDTPRPPDARLRRAARHADAHVAWSHEVDAVALVARLRADGWRVAALELATTSVDVSAWPVARGDRVCLVLGAEDAGVPEALLAACEACVHIPMRGHNSSMNVAVAAGIAVHAIACRLAAG